MPFFWFVPAFVWKGLAITALLGGVYFYVHNEGAKSAVEKIEAANAKSVSVAHKGSAGTRNPAARGVRDPYTVD